MVHELEAEQTKRAALFEENKQLRRKVQAAEWRMKELEEVIDACPGCSGVWALRGRKLKTEGS